MVSLLADAVKRIWLPGHRLLIVRGLSKKQSAVCKDVDALRSCIACLLPGELRPKEGACDRRGTDGQDTSPLRRECVPGLTTALRKEGAVYTVLLCVAFSRMSNVHALPQPLYMDLLQRIPADPTSSSLYGKPGFNLMLFVVMSDVGGLCANILTLSAQRALTCKVNVQHQHHGRASLRRSSWHLLEHSMANVG
jgi:hypothetical protein